MQLNEYINQLAETWCAATGRTAVALGGVVMNDGKFMGRLRGGGTLTARAFEKFLGFFRNGDNWPDNVIPMAAADLLDRLENIASEADAMSTGQNDDASREVAS